MIQVLSFALFASVMLISILAIVATVKAELPYIFRALGIDPTMGRSCPRHDLGLPGAIQPNVPLPPVHQSRAPRIRVTRPLREPASSARSSLRAAA